MKRFVIIFQVIVFLNLISCRKTCGDPAPSNIYFRFLNKNDSTNLVFGSSGIYKKDSLVFYRFIDTTKIIFEKYTNDEFAILKVNDSLISIFPEERVSKVYLKFSNNNTDTIDLTFKKSGSNSCGYQTYVNTLQFKNKLVVKDSFEIYTIYK
jgi:hypothetical protein